MVEMKLRALKLKNFKGLKAFKLTLNDGNITIYGDNATGKSTLKDAFLWLLFGKDSQGKTDFEIKTIDPQTSQAIHNLEHEVEGVLVVDGKELTLRKSYYEQWRRKRGSADKVFSGHTTDYFINSIPVKKNEYDTKVASLAGGEEIFKLLTDPGYYNEQLHWEKRREILLKVCGDISDKDVIASNESLTQLEDIISERSLEDHRKILQARGREINKELEKIPIRIDEVVLNLPDISEIQVDEVSTEIKELKEQKQKKEQELLRLESGGEIAEKTKKLREIEAELLDIKNKHQEQNQEEIEKLKKILYDKKDEAQKLESNVKVKEYLIGVNNNAIKNFKTEIETYRKNWHGIDSFNFNEDYFDSEQEIVCPTCGQKLPEEKLQKAREKALSDFNQEKAQKLKEVTARGKHCKEELDRIAKVNSDIEQGIKDIKKQIATFEKETEKIQKEIDTLQKQAVDISENGEYVKGMVKYSLIVAKIEEKKKIEKSIVALREGNEEISLKIKEEITGFRTEIALYDHSLSQVEQCKKGQSRIGELKTQEKQLAIEYEKLEKELYLLDQFTRTKVNILEKKINSQFKMARFKLFITLVNGGIEECCKTTYEGVPYSTLNNGARKNVGMDIINRLSEYYGFIAPIWFDNREAVTDLIKTKGQLISLVVSKKDKTLRIEQNGGNK